MPKKKTDPPKKIRRKIGTKDKQKSFLQAYADTCSMVAAAKKAHISRTTHYRWLEEETEYREVFKQTQHLAREYLESELVIRATKGWLEPVFYQGTRCGTVRRFDGSTGMALLRGMWPEKYGTQRQEISGPQGTPLQARIEVVFVKPPTSE